MSTLALIHGFLGSPKDWTAVRGQLQHPSVALEIPEASDWNAGIDALAAQLPDQSVVAGYSMGARIALGCALRHQERLRALVFVSGNPGLSDDLRDQRWRHDKKVCDDLRQLPPEQFLQQWYRQDVFSSLTVDQITSLVDDKRDLDANRFVGLMKCYSVARQPNYWDRLKELEIPVFLVAGDKDSKYVGICRDMQRRLANARLHLVEGAGHIVHRECPKKFAALLNDLMTDMSKENVLR